MNKSDYAAMSDQELRRYFLDHRDDKTAFQAYLDRLSKRPREIITTVDDPNFDAKVQAAVLRQIEVKEDNGEAEV